MKRLIFTILVNVFFACNSIKEQAPVIYPQQIIDLQMKDVYDSAMWYLYTFNCDVLYKPKNDTLISKPFSELELKFTNLFITNDTLILGFDFIDKGYPILSGMTRDGLQLVSGVGFNTVKKEKIEKIELALKI
jgi:hypothetical protein